MADRVRSPRLHEALRNFGLGCFFQLSGELEDGAELHVALQEHGAAGRPTLYEYRPLVGRFVEERAASLGERDDAYDALEVLKDEPAAGIFARAHASERIGEDEALRRTILLPIVVRVAERCGGFEWDDRTFDEAYLELERTLFGARRTYRAVAPLVGLSAGAEIELGPGLRVRAATPDEFAGFSDAERSLPQDFGREVDRTLVLELERELAANDPLVPDAPLVFGNTVSALRLATPGAIAAGPVLFELLDRRPYAVRPLPAVTAQQPHGEPTRLDQFRARIAAQMIELLTSSGVDPDLLEALDRWELALFQRGPTRSDELREALVTLLGGDEGSWAAAMRASALLGRTADERSELLQALRALVDGDGPGARAEDVVRRCLVEALLHGSREALLGALDETLLGVRERLPFGDPDRVAAGAR
ncbi:MAG: hypothetical protein R3C15_05465 [Thermoleophilia bacterium]